LQPIDSVIPLLLMIVGAVLTLLLTSLGCDVIAIVLLVSLAEAVTMAVAFAVLIETDRRKSV